MRQTSGRKSHGEKVVNDIRRATRKQYSAEEKIRMILRDVSIGKPRTPDLAKINPVDREKDG